MNGNDLIEFEEAYHNELADKFITLHQLDYDTFVMEEYTNHGR